MTSAIFIVFIFLIYILQSELIVKVKMPLLVKILAIIMFSNFKTNKNCKLFNNKTKITQQTFCNITMHQSKYSIFSGIRYSNSSVIACVNTITNKSNYEYTKQNFRRNR
jgi:hypothetical protein